ncbi:Bgt-3475 [Blumeria graminis f. sp. tritici]|uniref:Bgt-3475 n=2 Tax=Blumeria graminis f. sp. tritici TaxID=62690 RepID=A0A9X9MNC4_BLUGR|nr:hypothetical protein BGT96224_3475 [Blumeria graminis f. sp. tritici 96224]VDB93952.1 Bgt-3475 [Blumeria graminis f. sp. tritici]
MATRYSAARPKREGEIYARTIHGESSSQIKKPKFDVRNPSALAPDAREADFILQADVIRDKGTGTKRGAVNIDGYDSDSENDGFDARAEERAKAKGKKYGERVSLAEAFENNNCERGQEGNSNNNDDEDEDMFAELESAQEDARLDGGDDTKRKAKEVRFLDEDEIVGQISSSKSGGHISKNFTLDPSEETSTFATEDRVSSDDEEEALLNAMEEDVDEEVGAGGLKRNAPKVDAFNMKSEQEEGRFDEAGNYVRKAADPDAKHDVWLEGVSKKEMRKAAEAHEKRESELRKKSLEDDAVMLSDILRTLIMRLEKGETVLEALARLGKSQNKIKKVPRWKMNKKTRLNGNEGMIIDNHDQNKDPVQSKIREDVVTITEAADQLLTRGQTDIYEQEREILIRQYTRETGEDWKEPNTVTEQSPEDMKPNKMWEYRWTDGRDDFAKQGPFDGTTMLAWKEAGYFNENVEFRRQDDTGPWNRIINFE